MTGRLPCSLLIKRALIVNGVEREVILSCGEDQHHIYCPAYYQKFIADAEAALAECEDKRKFATAIANQAQDRCRELEADIEQGFMEGAYARLKNLQDAERKLATARECQRGSEFQSPDWCKTHNRSIWRCLMRLAALTEAGEPSTDEQDGLNKIRDIFTQA